MGRSPRSWAPCALASEAPPEPGLCSPRASPSSSKSPRLTQRGTATHRDSKETPNSEGSSWDTALTRPPRRTLAASSASEHEALCSHALWASGTLSQSWVPRGTASHRGSTGFLCRSPPSWGIAQCFQACIGPSVVPSPPLVPFPRLDCRHPCPCTPPFSGACRSCWSSMELKGTTTGLGSTRRRGSMNSECSDIRHSRLRSTRCSCAHHAGRTSSRAPQLGEGAAALVWE
mmetsp:Transcript_59270/g.141255  ORF Transcript_59270/g.141255 Transcript_59270/m.141255 type:complete len:231 (-) Transcript_59270:1721-2413(-)